MIELGGNIKIAGFKDLDGGSKQIVKKMVGNYTRKLSEMCTNFEGLDMTIKPVHAGEEIHKYELHAKVIDNGKALVSEVVDRNLFVAIDAALKKIENSIQSRR